METVRRDILFAFRGLRQSPGFTLVVVLTLALGIGANGAIFSVVNSVLFQPLPYQDPEQIVRVYATHRVRGWDHINVSYPDLMDFKQQSQLLQGLAGFTRTGVNFSGQGEPERLEAALMTPGLFELMKLPPVLGRSITAEEAEQRRDVAVITEKLWKRRFGGRQDLIGQTVILNGRDFTVIGVVPDIPRLPEVWIPLSPSGATLSRSNRFLSVVGRMKAGVTLRSLQTELEGIAANLETGYPETNKNYGLQLESLKSALVDTEDRVLFGVLLGFVTLVLAIGCANVANLMLARAGLRQREMAMRATLGASRRRLLRLLLTESLVLASIGGILGLALGYAGLQALLGALPPFVPRLEEMRMDGWALAYTAGVTLLAGLLFGLAPALQLSRPNLSEALKLGGSSGAPSRKRLRSMLAVSQVALALGLLICSGLFLQSFLKMATVDLGFRTENVLTFQVTLPQARYAGDERVALVYQQIVDRVKALPGVENVGLTSRLPMGRGGLWRGYIRDGDPAPHRDETPSARYQAVTPDYLRALGVRLLAGRQFEPRDEAEEPKVAIINQKMAERLWPNENAVGKRIRIHTDEDCPREVVGVVGNMLHDVEDSPVPQVFVPHRQTTWFTMTVVARTQGDPYALRTQAQAAIQQLDSNLPIYDVIAMSDVVAREVLGFRVLAMLTGTLGSVALGLAMMGIYGVVAYTVRQRTREIGVRVALGAQRRDILAMILRQGALLAGVGIVVGLGIGAAVNQLLASTFEELVAMSPALWLAAAAALFAIALVATYVPALRATRVDAMEALRYE